ncbi:MAG: hypothetical protein AB1540_00060 [Bdellovibrionota bacterium]
MSSLAKTQKEVAIKAMQARINLEIIVRRVIAATPGLFQLILFSFELYPGDFYARSAERFL